MEVASVALGHALAALGKLYREMELHSRESTAQSARLQARGLAIPGNDERPPLVTGEGHRSGRASVPASTNLARQFHIRAREDARPPVEFALAGTLALPLNGRA